MDRIELARKVKDGSPRTIVIIMSQFEDDAHIYESLVAGARGYVVKSRGIDDLPEAIYTVVSGQVYLTPPISTHRIESYAAKAGKPSLTEMH